MSHESSTTATVRTFPSREAWRADRASRSPAPRRRARGEAFADAARGPESSTPDNPSRAARPEIDMRCLDPHLLQGLLLLLMNLQNALTQVQDMLREILERWLPAPDPSHGRLVSPEGCFEQRPEGEEEEAVEVDEPEGEEEFMAMMQGGHNIVKTNKAKDAGQIWRPITAEERRELVQMLKDNLEAQRNASPTLFLLAMLQARMDGACPGGESSEEEEVTVGQLRPGLIRWLSTTPRSILPSNSSAP